MVSSIHNMDCTKSSRSQSCSKLRGKKRPDELSIHELTTYKIDLEKNLKDVNGKDEIESIQAEIYNLKMLTAKGK